MQDIREESLNESVKSEQSPRVVLWEIDLTYRVVSGIFSVMS
ncbi:phage minor tail protein L [Shigella sonnei]|nr:putative minor tail protein [Escherichia coli]SUJ49822.1 phage minor tail protein L [Shigella sonnei]